MTPHAADTVIARVRAASALAPAVFAAWLAAACGDAGGSEGRAADSSRSASATEVVFSAAQVQHGGVRWAPATTESTADVIELPAQLVPDEDRTARLGAPAQGRVMRVHVQLGDRVARGQPLVTLQSEAAGTARADLDKAAAELASRRAAAAYARAALERAERLLAAKAASRQEVERARADDELARSALAQAEAEAARARASVTLLGGADAAGLMVVRAPLAGIVIARDAAPGTVAESGAPLVAVTDPATLWLEMAAPGQVASAVRVGARTRFTVPALPADTFSTRVRSVGGALDPATRTLPVRAVVDNRTGRLRPAMFGTSWIDGAAARPTVVVPGDAVQMLDERPVIFVAHPLANGSVRFERRDARASGAAGGRTVVAQGVVPGELVVVAGAFAVKSEFARSKMAGE